MQLPEQIEKGLASAYDAAIAEARRQKLGGKRLDNHVRGALLEYARSVDVQISPTVGITEAAEILGVPKPRIYKLDEQGRMPKPWRRHESGPVYWEHEVRALAAELKKERSERKRRAAA